MRVSPQHTLLLHLNGATRSAIVSRIDHAVVVVVNGGIRGSSPSWERNRFTTPTENRKSEDEHEDLGTSIQSGSGQVVVLDEEQWSILAQPPLASEANDEEAQDRRVDAHEEVAHEPEDD